MPRCPLCAKKLKTRMAVMAHMNQPLGACLPYIAEIAAMQSEISVINEPANNVSYQGFDTEASVNFQSASGACNMEEATMDVDDNSPLSPHEPMDSAEPTFEPIIKEHPSAGQTFGKGKTFLENFDTDAYARQRAANLYYPFSSKEEWELASFLLMSGLSMANITKFLSLKLVRSLKLSFQSAKDLRSRAEMLPKGPQWKFKPWEAYSPTKKPLMLFFRNPIECLQSLLRAPTLEGRIHYKPLQVFDNARGLMRVFTEWRTGDAAWDIQSQLPEGATLLGTMLSSDKTNISAMTGGREAHPLLISLANIDFAFRMKASNHLFLLLALLPIPKFIEKDKKVQGMLTARLFHACLDFITQPLKKAAEIGVMMSDPTLSQLISLESQGADPLDLKAYGAAAMTDWPLAQPDQFWDHDVKWCIRAIGGAELDFRFSILHPATANLKQVTGREHRDIQRYLISVIAAVRALMDFRYAAQAPRISDRDCAKIEQSLSLFHQHKDAIIKAGARRGKKNVPITHWHIPKLESFQIPIQWSADVTERAHISEIKHPSHSTNNQKYEAQIVRHLDREEKYSDDQHAAMQLLEGIVEAQDQNGDSDDSDHDGGSTNSIKRRTGYTSSQVNYFARAAALVRGEILNAPLPYRTFAVEHTAFHLRRDPTYRRLNLDQLVDNTKQYHAIGGRRPALVTDRLPLDVVDVWTSVRVQSKSYHYPHGPLPSQAVHASPPSAEWQHGRCDPVVVNTDPVSRWPYSGLKGHTIAQLRVIMRIIPNRQTPAFATNNPFVAYVDRFDIIPQATASAPEPASSLHVLKRAHRANGRPLGDIVPLSQLRSLVSLVPRFGEKADSHLTKTTCLAFSTEFWLNKYFTKELYYALDE
ncbi:hypothetical protein F5887DRAFT_1063304 [Amanita rubescens]|nr:hypothetical protein F5887DRAFT_1063304 [Amanita rubescens]